MNEEVLRKIKENVKELCPDIIPVFVYRWIESLVLISLNSNNKVVLLGIPTNSDDVVSYTKRQYGDIICKVAAMVVGEEYTINIERCEPIKQTKKEFLYRPFPNKTFKEFRVGKYNQDVVDKIKKFVDSPCGGVFLLFSDNVRKCGKTHLAQAAAHEFKEKHNEECAYFTADTFLQFGIVAIRNNSWEQYNNIFYNEKYPHIVIDDIHFLFDKGTGIKLLIDLLKSAENSKRHIILTMNTSISQVRTDPELLRLMRNMPMAKVSKMQYKFHLQRKPFEKIYSGKKTIELRMNDEKRRNISVGNIICFVYSENPLVTMEVEVTAIHRFDTFQELYDALPLTKCGYDEDDIPDAYHDMEKYPGYSLENQKRLGVLGIEFKKIPYHEPFRDPFRMEAFMEAFPEKSF